MQASAKSIAPMQSASGRNVADRAAVVRCWPFKPDDDGKPLQLRPEPMTVAFSACNVQHQFHAVATTIHILGRTGQAERVLAALVLPGDIHPDLLTLRVSPGVHRPPPPELRKRRQRPRQALLHAIRILSDVEAVHVITQAAAPTIAWNNRGVGLPTQDVVVCSLPMDLQMLILRCLRDRLVPHIQALYPQHSAVLEQRPMPRPSNLFIVRYSASGQRGLKLHEDETALTFNVCLSTRMDFTGGGTFFPCKLGAGLPEPPLHIRGLAPPSLAGIVMRPAAGVALIHDGNITHAGCNIDSGERLILVGFYTDSDLRDEGATDAAKPPAHWCPRPPPS